MVAMELRMVEGPALPPSWRQYRDGFVALQHLCALSREAGGAPVLWQRVVADLGFGDEQAEAVLNYLLVTESVRYLAGQRRVALRPTGLRYLRAECGRRASLRPAPLEPPTAR